MEQETERDQQGEIILARLKEKVREFGPGRFLEKEKRAQINEAVVNGLDLIASTIKEKGRRETWDYWSLKMRWDFQDFVRTAITMPPLPLQTFQVEEKEVTLEQQIADGHNWLFELSEEQLGALWTILEEDIGLPRPELQERKEAEEKILIFRSTKTFHLPATEDYPANTFQPALVVDREAQEMFLTCFVKE